MTDAPYIADAALMQEAALWYARMEGGADTSARAEFLQWKAVPEHAAAYGEIADSMRLFRSAAKTPGILALRQETMAALVVAHQRHHSGRIWPAALGGAVAAGLAVAVWFGFQPHSTAPVAGSSPGHAQIAAATPSPATPTLYATAVGQRLSVTLPDGSTAMLNTATRLKLAYGADARRVILQQGQAVFHVAKGKKLPFIVVAGDRAITAHGTTFDVRLAKGSVSVALFEGKVTVTETKGGAETALLPNQLLVASPTSITVKPIASPERLSSWQTGMVVFENEPLSTAVGEINRYVRRPVVVGDPQLASLRISGAFQTGDTGAFVEAMQLYFPVRADETNPDKIVLTRRP